MSKINKIRIMNLNYNGNAIRIDDETFDLNGESTLLSLRNGGGKTVLVQMVMSLFVNKTYRDFEDRPFKSYFTTNRPTFLMTEWTLDYGQGYFLAGMMVRKCQNAEENNNEELEMINFTAAYSEACPYDLEHLPVIEESEKGRVLKGFGTCRREFEELKKNRGFNFDCYDMASAYQRRQYFTKLKEYQINHKEWETIIKKVNLKESGLSELFTNARDEKGLVEKWFLDAVENKLNQGSSRIKEFQSLAYKLVRQYRDNQSKITRKEMIESYFEDSQEIGGQISSYLQAQKELEQHKSRMAVFIRELNIMEEKLNLSLEGERQELEALRMQMKAIEHERISFEIYGLQDERKVLAESRIESEMRINRSEYARAEAEKELCRFQCAGLYEETEDFSRKISALQAKLELLLEEKKDSEEERKRLGGILYQHYQGDIEKYTGRVREKDSQIQEGEKGKKENEERYEAELLTVRELSGRIGERRAAIQGYDRVEQQFTERFQTELARNIVGEYEEGVLELYERKFQDELLEIHTQIVRLSEELIALKKEEEKLNTEGESLKVESGQCRYELEELRKDCLAMEEEQERRKNLMRYLEAPEEEFDKKELLLRRFDRKIEELELLKTDFLEKHKALLCEYDNLSQGKIMELPENISNYFEEQGISFLYGMEWLKRNGRGVLENQKLTEENPFLPYSIIMDRKALETLELTGKELYTSFPIPIILKEKLEEVLSRGEGGLLQMGAVSFYVMFNRHLLDPAELEKLLRDKKQQADFWKERMERKAEETEEYRRYRNVLEQQRFTLSKLEERNRQIAETGEKERRLSKEYIVCSQNKKRNAERQQEERKKLDAAAAERQRAERRQEEYQELTAAYKRYLSERQEKERFEKRCKEAGEKAEQWKTEALRINEQIQSWRDEKKRLEGLLSKSRVAAELFLAYQEEVHTYEPEEYDYIALEARYRAITEGISVSLEDLNRDLKEERFRYDRKSRELEKKNKYGFPIEVLREIAYSEERAEYLEEQIKNASRAENAAKEENKRLETQMARLDTRIEYAGKQLEEKTGYAELKPREQILQTDFDARKKLTEYEWEKKELQERETAGRLEACRGTQAAMAEYMDFEITDETAVRELEETDREELNRYQGILRRDFRKLTEEREEQRRLTETLLLQNAKKEKYRDDFFRKGFDNLLELGNNVYDLKIQFETILESYDSMLKKLQVDLESIGKERENIEEIFLDYVRDIDNNLRQIDKNSSILIRGKSVRMLKINVPDWEENRELYQTKVRDYTDTFIRWGAESIENNQNIEELLGKLITTKKLYDDVVGIGNIGIRLYKIEAEREVQISWAEVSANSGGEGFLSAFVILTCLLSYMRREESDLFAAGEEGKVLIMDNPFAQTNAVHLLKPLMDMAKKSNTQLICLSGLGGDSIYNRFDNIYVLNVVNSSIRKGMQYLKSEHIKGEESRKVVPSHFKTEQMSLFDMEIR